MKVTDADGTVSVFPQKHLGLKDDAVPTIFPNLPKYYLSTKSRLPLRDPQERREEIIQHKEKRLKMNEETIVMKNSFGLVNSVGGIQSLKTGIKRASGAPIELSNAGKNEKKRISLFGRDLSLIARISTSKSICIVPGCGKVKTENSEESFFMLPSVDERRQQWLKVCKREELMNNMAPNLTVCSDHFISEQFTSLSRKALKEYAVPTVFSFQPSLCNDEFILGINDQDDSDEHTEFVGNYTVIKSEPDIECFLDSYTDSEDDDIREHPGQLCRLCANNTGDVIYIFSSTGRELDIEKKINSSLPILVQNTDRLPKQLCSSCVLKLDVCYEFSQSCIKAEAKLKSLMELNQFVSYSAGPADESCKNYNSKVETDSVVKNESYKLNCRQGRSFSELQNNKNKIIKNVEENVNNYCCPLCCEGRMMVQSKDVSNSAVSVDVNERSNEESCSSTQSMELKELDNDSKQNNISDKVSIELNNMHNNVVYEVQDDDGNNYTLVEGDFEWWNEDNALENTEIIIQTLNSGEALAEIDDDDDDDGFPMNNWDLANQMEVESPNSICQLCGKVFASEMQCLDHSKDHIEDGCYPCSMCGLIFSTEIDITSHCEEHKTEETKENSKLSRGRLNCGICGRRFNNEKTLRDHVCGNIEQKHFRCEICKKAYISEERLAFHRKFHEGARPNYCDQCGKEFDNEGSLYYHTRMVHQGARPFCCEECGKRFYSNARLEAHKRVHSGERPFECEVCGRRFYNRETLKGHYITHMSVKPFQCDLCGVCCGRKSMLKQHIETHHSETYMPKRVPSLIHYFCKICNETFTSSSDVLTHRSSHWGTLQSGFPKAHICEFCGQSFSVINSLGRHRKQEHPNEQPYVCSICKETSRTLYEARAHRKTHTTVEEFDSKEKIKIETDKLLSQKVYICEECGKPMPGRRKFLAHMKTHRMDFAFECTECGKKFTEKQRLQVHMRLHTGEKPYSCSECGKRFTQSSALYTHALLHTGEKPHACDLCGKAFRIKADRDNHRRTHTGEKPYKCEFCGKQFRTGQVYYQHRMIHTGERRFPCEICGKAFKRSHTLVVHKRIHTGEKPNICDVCGRGFRQRTDMRKHRALHIGI